MLHCYMAAVCNSCNTCLYSHPQSVVGPATLTPEGYACGCLRHAMQRRSAMCERWNEQVESVGIHSGCTAVNDTK